MLHNVNLKKVWKIYRSKPRRRENSKVKIVKATLCAVCLAVTIIGKGNQNNLPWLGGTFNFTNTATHNQKTLLIATNEQCN
jgi:hypothetical protein